MRLVTFEFAAGYEHESLSPSLMSVVTDTAGKAVLRLPTDAEIQSLYAVKHGVGFDYKVVTTRRDKAHRAQWLNEPPIRFH